MATGTDAVDDDADSSEHVYEALLREAVLGFAEAYVSEGRLDIDGLTDDEIVQSTRALLRTDLTQSDENLATTFSISFDQTLLTEARRFAANEQLELAVLVYATWFEHWLNAMILWGLDKRGLDYKEAKIVLRGGTVESKTGHLWRLIFDDHLPIDIMRPIRRIAAQRNEFVHYKWAQADTWSKQRINDTAEAEAAVTACRLLEDTLVFGGSRETIKRAILGQFEKPAGP